MEFFTAYTSLFLHLNVKELLLTHERFIEQSKELFFYHKIDKVSSCYICMKDIEDINIICEQEYIQERVVDFILLLIEFCSNELEITLEFASNDSDVIFLSKLLCNNKKLHSIRGGACRIRISLDIDIYCNVFTYMDNIHTLSQDIEFDIRVVVDESNLFNATLKDALQHAYDVHPYVHLSVEWNVLRLHRKECLKILSQMLKKFDLHIYQYWHFSKNGYESVYLRNIYLLLPYLGLILGENNDEYIQTISWQIGNDNVSARMGVSDSNAFLGGPSYLDVILWDECGSKDEVALRFMQSACTEGFYVPSYLISKSNNTLFETLRIQGYVSMEEMKHTKEYVSASFSKYLKKNALESHQIFLRNFKEYLF